MVGKWHIYKQCLYEGIDDASAGTEIGNHVSDVKRGILQIYFITYKLLDCHCQPI